MPVVLPSAMPDFACRSGCGACCIAPSISSAIPGMPDGKPAGVRCVQLTDDHRCALFGSPERPEICNRLRASVEMCGGTAEEAYDYLARLERLTRQRVSRAEPTKEKARTLTKTIS